MLCLKFFGRQEEAGGHMPIGTKEKKNGFKDIAGAGRKNCFKSAARIAQSKGKKLWLYPMRPARMRSRTMMAARFMPTTSATSTRDVPYCNGRVFSMSVPEVAST